MIKLNNTLMSSRSFRKDFMTILLCFLLVLPSIAFADWEATLKSNFAIVDTFDNLTDWNPSKGGGNYYGAQYGPKKLDGSNSKWTYYSSWSLGTNVPWISNFGTGTSITGKSAKIDIGGAEGPSRLGMYFGNGTASSGYSDIYIFYRVKYPQNEWPTSIAGGSGNNNPGSYVEGQPWTWWDSWKVNTVNMGCTGVNAETQCPAGALGYSTYHIVPHVKAIGNPAKLIYTIEANDVNGAGRNDRLYASGYEVPRNAWTGVEFHYRNDSNKVTHIDVWIYDSSGVAHQVANDLQYTYSSQPVTDKWNFFWIGGNNSSSYSWGSTMKSAYYVDDFIINGSRIGPTYYGLLSGTAPSISAPKNVIGVPK